ncbi:hypothetical protein [Mesorhizobium sp. M0185]|uniref:hypothetical protein n=1 Tax=unclassified Mesorhizobium TaxID=325217 RepID=UPI00333B137F
MRWIRGIVAAVAVVAFAMAFVVSTNSVPSVRVVEVAQLVLFVVVMGAALVSAIFLIRDRQRIAAENLELHIRVNALSALHRDLKPANLRLKGGRPDEITSVDFHINIATEFLAEPRIKLDRAPAERLVGLLRAVFSRRAFEAIFSQIVIDGREEYFEALSMGRTHLARWRLTQIYLIVIFTALTWTSVSITQKAIQIWRVG